MNGIMLHPTPSWRAIIGEQLRSVGVANQREMLVAGALLLIYGMTNVYVGLDQPSPTGPALHIGMISAPMAIVALFVPMAVWKASEPSRRTYFLAMPANPILHSLVRVFAGWIWMMGFVAVVLLLHLGLLTIVGGSATAGIPGSIENNEWFWSVPFTAATIAYLLASIVVLSTDFPWRWYAGITVAFIGSFVWSVLNGSRVVQQVLVEGPYGTTTWLIGSTSQPYQVTDPTGRSFEILALQPDLRAWIIASSIWIGAALVGILLAAYRYQEA